MAGVQVIHILVHNTHMVRIGYCLNLIDIPVDTDSLVQQKPMTHNLYVSVNQIDIVSRKYI